MVRRTKISGISIATLKGLTIGQIKKLDQELKILKAKKGMSKK